MRSAADESGTTRRDWQSGKGDCAAHIPLFRYLGATPIGPLPQVIAGKPSRREVLANPKTPVRDQTSRPVDGSTESSTKSYK